MRPEKSTHGGRIACEEETEAHNRHSGETDELRVFRACDEGIDKYASAPGQPAAYRSDERHQRVLAPGAGHAAGLGSVEVLVDHEPRNHEGIEEEYQERTWKIPKTLLIPMTWKIIKLPERMSSVW